MFMPVGVHIPNPLTHLIHMCMRQKSQAFVSGCNAKYNGRIVYITIIQDQMSDPPVREVFKSQLIFDWLHGLENIPCFSVGGRAVSVYRL